MCVPPALTILSCYKAGFCSTMTLLSSSSLFLGSMVLRKNVQLQQLVLLGSPHWPDAKFQEKPLESISQRDLLLSKSEVEMAFCFQETTCKGVAFSQHNLLLSIDRDLNAVYLNHLHSCRNNWHFLEVTVIGILKQCIEARISEPSHYESFWMVWFKMPWLYCFMQMWFLCAKPPTVSKALISFPVTAKWTE